jgi:porin
VAREESYAAQVETIIGFSAQKVLTFTPTENDSRSRQRGIEPIWHNNLIQPKRKVRERMAAVYQHLRKGLLALFVSGNVSLCAHNLRGEDEDPIDNLIEDSKAKPELALPPHPHRKPIDVEKLRPKESQPGRQSLTSSTRTTARTTQQLMPGHPGRNLGIPSSVEEADEAEASSCDALEAPVEPILWIIPRELRGGGITFECVYTGETFTKAKGGLRQGRPTNYRSNLDVVAIADTGKLGWWDRGRLFVYGQNLSGRPISESEVGDFQLFSNLDSTIGPGQRPQFTAVSEYWYEQYFADDIFSVRIGKQDTNTIFALTDLGGEFVHSSFGAPPIIPMPTFPSNALGLSSFLKLTETITLGFGIYDGTLANGPQGVRWGFDTLGRNGAFSLYQAEFKPQLGKDGEYPTTVRVGMWHHSDKEVWTELSASPNPITFNQNYGFFLTGDQMIFKENGAADEQGLGVFAQYFSAPDDRNVVSDYVGGGLVYKGFVPGRDDDYVGLGFAKAIFGDGFRAQEAMGGTIIGNAETATELFYKWVVGPKFSLQPDLQYIASPSGQHRDAIVGGLRFEAVF